MKDPGEETGATPPCTHPEARGARHTYDAPDIHFLNCIATIDTN